MSGHWRVPFAALVLLLLAGQAWAGLPGDVDADCDIDIADAVLLERALAGFVTLTDERADNADLIPIGGSAKDNVIDVGDLVTLKRLVAGDETKPTPVAAPVIDSVTGTNPVTVSGSGAPPGWTVLLYVNGDRFIPTVIANGNGEFTFFGKRQDPWDDPNGPGSRQVPLNDGDNQITVVATSGGVSTCSSAPWSQNFVAPAANNPPDAIPADSLVVWTKDTFEGQPVIIHSTVTVPANSVLFIQPGVDLRFDAGAKLQAAQEGNLQIHGTSENTVLLGPTGGVGSSCNGTTRWDGLQLLAHAGTDPGHLIEHAHIDCVTTGVSAGQGTFFARLDLRDSEISNWSNIGVSTQSGTTATIIDNQLVAGPGLTGIYATGTSTINRNVVRAQGNVVSLQGVPQSFKGNDVRDGKTTGVHILGSTDPIAFNIEENTITNNCNGVVLDWYAGSKQLVPTLLHNSIYANENCTGGCGPYPSTSCANYTTYLGQGCQLPPPMGLPDLIATDNWWGTIDANDIDSHIHGYCNPSPPIVYIPYLDAPFDEAGVSVGAGNVIQGDIDDSNKPLDTDWIVLGTARVPPDKTLEIPDGTTIEFGEDAQLIVEGTLRVLDQSADDVVFTALVGTGETAAPGDWQGILVRDGGGIVKANAEIADAVIEFAGPAIDVTDAGSSLDVSGSLVRKFSGVGIRIQNDAEADIHDNRDVGGTLGIFAGAGKDGIQVENVDPAKSVRITNNEIKNASAAIRVEDASPGVYGNLIRASNFGVFVGENANPEIASDPAAVPPVPGNDITGNCWGIYVNASATAPQPEVHYNKIHANNGCQGNGSGNFNYYIASYPPNSVPELSADLNWWGTSSATTIATSIYDRSESTSLPTVNFVQFYEDSGLQMLDTNAYLLGPMTGNLTIPGPHLVVGDLFIAPGDTWQIGQGVVLEFPQKYPIGYQVLVEGDLEIAGDPSSHAILRLASGAQSWGGISVSGTGASVTIHDAEISGASTLIDVDGTSQLVSITDSELTGFTSSAIYLENVDPGGATIERNTITGGTSSGTTGVAVVDSTATVQDGNLISDVGVGVLVFGANSNATIGSTATAQNQITDFAQVGVLFTGVPGGEIANNKIENVATSLGTGILLDGSSPHVYQNQIRYTDIGIHVIGASAPLIGELAPATPPSNEIALNRIGIRLEGTPTVTNPDSDQPFPTIQGNDLSGNLEAALEVVDYDPGTARAIDATRNWWGDDTAAGVRAQILLDPTNPRPVDFSTYLDASMQGVGGSDLFSTVISRVSRSAETFTPTIGAGTVTITVDLASAMPQDLTLDIYDEDEVPRTLVHHDDASSVAVSHPFIWDGRDDNSQIVDNDAYVYVVTAGPSGSLGAYDPPRVSTGTHVAGIGTPDTYNVNENDFLKVPFQLQNGPGRIDLELRTQQFGGMLIRKLFQNLAYPEGVPEYLFYDGRDLSGVIEDDAQASRYFYIPVAQPLYPNHVIVEGVRPRVQPPDYDPQVPRIEVLSDPYYIVNSYDQVSTIVFQTDQPANVTIQFFDKDMGAVSSVTPLTPVTPPPDPNLDTYQVTWSGIDLLSGTAYNVEDESYTFEIVAINPTQPTLSTTYRGVIQVRR